MTWLDVGNGWRNLFLLSCALQALALGCLFCAHGWFVKQSKAACFLTGVASTPLLQYLWMLALALVWPHAPQKLLIAVPPLAAALGLAVMAVRRLPRIRLLWRKGLAFARRVCHFDKPALVCLCFAVAMALLLTPAMVRFMSSMDMVNNGDSGEYLALAQRYCEDRSLVELLEKNETEGHFRGHSHFPSLELYMSYGLMHTGGQVGYPNDKACFTGLGMLVFYALAAYGALLCVFCRQRKGWMLLGALLFNLVPDLYYSISGAPRDMWRILALLWAVCLFAGLTPEGNWKRYVGKLVLCFAACFTVMSAHVVCFVVLPFIVAAWVIWRWMESLFTGAPAGRTLAGSLGLAAAGAAGTVTAFLGNLWCYRTWGQMSPWRVMSTYTTAPWYSLYMQMEYKAEETSTHLNFFKAMDSILRTYITPTGLIGFCLALAALLIALAYLAAARRRRRSDIAQHMGNLSAKDGPVAVFWVNRGPAAQAISIMLFSALVTLLTLAPMTGVLDTKIYSFSGSFLKMSRYTLQWFLFADLTLCAFLSTLSDLWTSRVRRAALKRLPAWLCAALCLVFFAQGVNQTGYSNTVYRLSRNVMEDQGILLDNNFQKRFGLLMDVAAAVPEDETILIPSPAYQYPLRGRAYLIPANPVVSILNLSLEEVGPELARRRVALIATEPGFWDDRYFGQSTLNDYLQTLPPEQVVETDSMRLYLLDPDLVSVAQSALAQRNDAALFGQH